MSQIRFTPMKLPLRHTGLLAVIGLTGSLAADTLYSNLQNTAIPIDFTGLFVDVDGANGWDVNPFFGGIGVANSPLFQPVRNGTGDLDRILNLSLGATVDINRLFATSTNTDPNANTDGDPLTSFGGPNYGGSQDHLANSAGNGKFVTIDDPLQQDYLGFRLNGVGYGWMRVFFTASGSPVVKDWAYDTSGTGGSIVVGRVQQSVAVALAQTVTLSPGSGESFTLGSLVSNTGGNTNDVIKTGSGTTGLSQANTYTGGTAVNVGTLLVNNSSGSGTGTGAVSVALAATLGGTGTLAPTGSNGINVSGVLAPGASLSIGTLTFNLFDTTGVVDMVSGSSFAFELGSANPTISSIGLNTSDLLSITGASSADFAFNSNNINFLGTGSNGYYKLFDTDSNNANTWSGLTFDGTTGVVSAGLSYTNLSGGLTGTFLVGTAGNGGTTGDIYFQVVPEFDVAALIGGFGVLALLRRRRVLTR